MRSMEPPQHAPRQQRQQRNPGVHRAAPLRGVQHGSGKNCVRRDARLFEIALRVSVLEDGAGQASVPGVVSVAPVFIRVFVGAPLAMAVLPPQFPASWRADAGFAAVRVVPVIASLPIEGLPFGAVAKGAHLADVDREGCFRVRLRACRSRGSVCSRPRFRSAADGIVCKLRQT